MTLSDVIDTLVGSVGGMVLVLVAALLAVAVMGLAVLAVKWGGPQLIGFFQTLGAGRSAARIERDQYRAWKRSEGADRYYDGPDW